MVEKTEKIRGIILSYKPKDKYAKVLFYHTFYGRIIHTTYMGRKYAYYKKGMLHDIEYAKLPGPKIFLKTLDGIDLDMLEIFGKIETEDAERENFELKFITAEQHWTSVAKEKGKILKKRR